MQILNNDTDEEEPCPKSPAFHHEPSILYLNVLVNIVHNITLRNATNFRIKITNINFYLVLF